MSCKSQSFVTYTNIDLVVRVPVTFDPGAPFTSLEGGEVDARAKTSAGAYVIGEAEIAEGGAEILVTFRRGTLPVGKAECQVWALVGVQAAMPFVFEADVRAGYRPVEA